jgi:ABC-type uncharacterized transport system ATPase subunit
MASATDPELAASNRSGRPELMSLSMRSNTASTYWSTASTAVGLSKTFGSRRVVDALRFEVGKGEVFGFLGPNGAGKANLGK